MSQLTTLLKSVDYEKFKLKLDKYENSSRFDFLIKEFNLLRNEIKIINED